MNHIIVANWKMNPSNPKEAQALFDSTKNAVGRLRSVNIILAPPAIYLQSLANTYRGNKINFAAQEISIYDSGSHTGDISAEQFSNTGANYALIGHSECMAPLEELRIETFMAMKHNLIPIVFIGESKRDNHGKYLKIIKNQILASLKELSTSQINDVIFCYEPVWAVGADKPMDSYDIHAMMLYIRKVLTEEYGTTVARKIQMLYGGSVNTENIKNILEIEDIDGVAVGRASTNIEQFTELLKIANKV